MPHSSVLADEPPAVASTMKLARARAARIRQAALGLLLDEATAMSLPPIMLGCLAVACRFASSLVDAATGRVGEIGVADVAAQLAMRGVSGDAAELAIRGLAGAGLFLVGPSSLRIPLLERVAAEHLRESANRSAGYKKRVTAGGVRAPAPPAPLEAPAVPPAEVPSAGLAGEAEGADLLWPLPTPQNALLPAEPAVRASRPASRGSSAKVRRYGVSDALVPDVADETVFRLACEGGRTAELTRSYVDHLKNSFPLIDVEQSLRLVAIWCESNPEKRKTFTGLRRFLVRWLAGDQNEAEIRKAVVRAGAQRNGFGQGGTYEAAPAGSDGVDDLADFAPAAAAPAPRPEPARPSRTAALRRPRDLAPQRRLSEIGA